MNMSNIEQFVTVSELDEPGAEADALFQRAFRVPVARFPGHFLAHVRPEGESDLLLACYVHATDCGDIVLLGGACTDGGALRRLSDSQQEQLRQVDGIYQHTMRVIQDRMRSRFQAMLACCGDARSEQVILEQGWKPTPHDQLFACWLQDATPSRRAQMIAKAKSFMPF